VSSKKELRAMLEQVMMQQIQAANARNPQLEMLKDYNKRIIEWNLNPTNQVKDIAKHPTIGMKLPVYQLAKSFRDKGRIGRGIAGLGGKNDSTYAKDLELQTDFERGITASGMLEQGLQGELDQAAGNLANLEAQDNARRTSSNSLLQYFDADLNRRISSGSFGGFMKTFVGGVAPALTGMLTGGLSTATGGLGSVTSYGTASTGHSSIFY